MTNIILIEKVFSRPKQFWLCCENGKSHAITMGGETHGCSWCH